MKPHQHGIFSVGVSTVLNRIEDVVCHALGGSVLVKKIEINFSLICNLIADKFAVLHVLCPVRNGVFVLLDFVKFG